MTKFINMTPHAIRALSAEEVVVFEPSGKTVRVDVKHGEECSIDGFVVLQRTMGSVVGLPDPEEGTFYIVSSVALDAAKISGRSDCLAPDTGSTAVRDPLGQIEYVTRFVR